MAPYISQHGDNPDLTSHTLGQLRIRSQGKWGDAVTSSRRKPLAKKDKAQIWEFLWFREGHRNRSWGASQSLVLSRFHIQSQADHRSPEVVLDGPLTVTFLCFLSLMPRGHRHSCITTTTITATRCGFTFLSRLIWNSLYGSDWAQNVYNPAASASKG